MRFRGRAADDEDEDEDDGMRVDRCVYADLNRCEILLRRDAVDLGESGAHALR